MIIRHTLKTTDIPFLHDSSTLYVCDFRAISESMKFKIPAMWKYENLLPWIIMDQHVVVNEDFNQSRVPNKNTFIVLKKHNDPRISVFERMRKNTFPKTISHIWIGIPHPAADTFAKKSTLKLSYTYKSFLQRNNKLRQKTLLEKYTPSWHPINSYKDLKNSVRTKKRGFLKRKYGSGGFTLFDNRTTKHDHNFNLLFQQNPRDWFFEEYIHGKTYSIQCLKMKRSNDVTVFGFAKQTIADGKYFCGAEILSLTKLPEKIWKQLQKSIHTLQPLLKGYEGFFGIDFIISKNNVFVLEANIRLTALTIPTLLCNNSDFKKVEYHEDVDIKSTTKNDMILAIDEQTQKADILQLCPRLDL